MSTSGASWGISPYTGWTRCFRVYDPINIPQLISLLSKARIQLWKFLTNPILFSQISLARSRDSSFQRPPLTACLRRTKEKWSPATLSSSNFCQAFSAYNFSFSLNRQQYNQHSLSILCCSKCSAWSWARQILARLLTGDPSSGVSIFNIVSTQCGMQMCLYLVTVKSIMNSNLKMCWYGAQFKKCS